MSFEQMSASPCAQEIAPRQQTQQASDMNSQKIVSTKWAELQVQL